MNTNGMDRLLRMRTDAASIFQAGLAAVEPAAAIGRHLHYDGRHLSAGGRSYDLSAMGRVLLVGAGKATAPMAAAVEALLGERVDQGIVTVKYGHTAPLKRTALVEAGHPLPDENGQAGARRMLALAGSAGERDLVIALMSGGGSALMPLPAPGLTLADKQGCMAVLLACGASIHEINAVRKHMSAIKGGRLALAARPAAVLTLILSDVVGDDLDVIASGPTVADGSTVADCREILDRHDIWQRLPPGVAAFFRGAPPETPKPGDPAFERTENRIVGSNREAVAAAAREAETRGYRPLVLSSLMEGETRHVARVHGAIAREVLQTGNPLPPPACLLSGGETTVTLTGDGRGGRNQEFALAAALDIAGSGPVVVLSGGTDGNDGPTDAAGAVADNQTVRRAAGQGMDARRSLKRNDAYPFFKQLDDLVITGPTNTNVMDLRIVLIAETANDREKGTT